MRLKAMVVAAALLTSAGVLRADTINVFSLAGTTSSGTLSGTVTLNATTGKFTNSNVTYVVGGLLGNTTYTFSGAPSSSVSGTGFSSNEFLQTGLLPAYDFDLTLPFASLVGYAGGALCTTANLCAGQASAVELLSTGFASARLTSGTLTLASQTGAPTPAAAVTPEPSSLLLLGTGVLGVASMMRKRFV